MLPYRHVARFLTALSSTKKTHAVQAAIHHEREAAAMDGMGDVIDSHELSPMQPAEE